MAVDGWDILYSEDGPGWAGVPPSPLLAVPNVTSYPSTANVPTSYYSMWHYIITGDGQISNKIAMSHHKY